MSKISWGQVSALALAAFFVVGSLSNIFAPPSIYEEYLRWGYPRWFHFVTGSLELTTAVLLARGQTRPWGSALGCTVMVAALATVTLHGEYGHGVAPLVVAALSILVGWIAWRKRLSSSHDASIYGFDTSHQNYARINCKSDRLQKRQHRSLSDHLRTGASS